MYTEPGSVDPILAVSVALLESGLNPRALGDNNTSFGLYQLHRGGELGSLTIDEAFDPVINTRQALVYFVVAERTHPGLTPGNLAAAAQRPKYPQLYAYQINLIYPMVKRVLASLGVYNG